MRRGKRIIKAKLQKQLAYKYKQKNVYKHVIVVPDDSIAELGWKGGQELELCAKNGKLVIEAKKTESHAS